MPEIVAAIPRAKGRPRGNRFQDAVEGRIMKFKSNEVPNEMSFRAAVQQFGAARKVPLSTRKVEDCYYVRRRCDMSGAA